MPPDMDSQEHRAMYIDQKQPYEDSLKKTLKCLFSVFIFQEDNL